MNSEEIEFREWLKTAQPCEDEILDKLKDTLQGKIYAALMTKGQWDSNNTEEILSESLKEVRQFYDFNYRGDDK